MLLGLRVSGLRSRIMLYSFVPTAIILALIAWVSFYAYQQVTEDLVMERNQELARLSAGELASALSELSAPLVSVARSLDVASMEPETVAAGLRRAANRLIIYDGGAVVLDYSGRVVTADPPRPEIVGQDWSSRTYFRRMLRAPGPIFSDILSDGPNRGQVVVVAVPIESPDGELLGVMAGMFRLDATAVSAFYGGIVRLRIGRSNIYLVDTSGRLIYHSDTDRIGDNVAGETVVQNVLSGEVGNLRTQDLDGRTILAGYAPVPGSSWGLVTEEDWSTLMAASQRYRQSLLFLLALGILIPVMVVVFGIGRILEPIRRLQAAAAEVASGSFDRRIEVNTGDELEELAGQFNLMSDRLRESYANLERRVGSRTRELAALNAIGSVVSQSLDLQEILEDALEKTIESVGLDAGQAYRLAEGPAATEAGCGAACLVLQATRGMTDEIITLSARLPFESSLARRAAEEGRPVTQSLATYQAGALRDAALQAGLQTVFAIPLTAKGRMLGALYLASLTPRTLSPEERSLLWAVGQQIGIAMENARLYEQAEEVAAAAERSRLARDLHDAVTQTLFSASLIADVLPRIWDKRPEEGRRRLEELRQLTRGALAEMRTLLLELRPSALAEAPLPDLLRQLAESTTGRARLPVSLEVDGEGALPPDAKIVFYRIAQEALNNVAKHSGATAAVVGLTYMPDAACCVVELSIADNGLGFDRTVVGSDHLGLNIMEERAESIGAVLDVDSRPGQGTEIAVRWKLPTAG